MPPSPFFPLGYQCGEGRARPRQPSKNATGNPFSSRWCLSACCASASGAGCVSAKQWRSRGDATAMTPLPVAQSVPGGSGHLAAIPAHGGNRDWLAGELLGARGGSRRFPQGGCVAVVSAGGGCGCCPPPRVARGCVSMAGKEGACMRSCSANPGVLQYRE